MKSQGLVNLARNLEISYFTGHYFAKLVQLTLSCHHSYDGLSPITLTYNYKGLCVILPSARLHILSLEYNKHSINKRRKNREGYKTKQIIRNNSGSSVGLSRY